MDHLNSSTISVKTASNREFGWVFTAFFCLIGFWPMLNAASPRTWALILAGLFALATLFVPTVLTPLNRLWTRFGALMHKIVNPIVLGLIYLLTIVPIGLIFKILNKDPLRLKRDPNASSYWIERQPPGPAADSLPRQF
jgi:predicted membrane metal-binding protein